jgi:hypothetical protein
MFHYTIGRDPKIDPPYHGKSITCRIATPAHCSSWVTVESGILRRRAASEKLFASTTLAKITSEFRSATSVHLSV